MIMKKAILFTLAVLMTVGLAAQTRPPQQQKSPSERAKETVDYLAARMSLTQKKQDAMIPAYTTFFEQMGEAKKAQDTKKADAAKKTLDTSLKKILTEAEYKQATQLMEERYNAKGRP